VAASDRDAKVSLSYWTTGLSEFQAENVADTFATIFRSLVEGSDLMINQLHTISDRDSKQISSWNQTQPATVDGCIHDIIMNQVTVQPNAAAICAWDASFTYEELDILSTQLAHHLVGLGVGPEVMVPLCFEKSAWAIVAMLGIMKAGGVFVPLDPLHPINRLSEIIQDVDASLLLSSAQHSDLFKSLVDTVFVVGPSISELLKVSGSPCTTVHGNNAAYVIFTSGSTGKPKGTVVEHTAYCSASAAHGKATLMGPSTRVLQFASYVFDACLVEILTALMYGACVCVPDEESRMNDAANFINATEVNWAVLTPSSITTIDPATVPGLEVLVLGGEAMSQRQVLTWASKVKLFNAYGPSECAVIATMNRVKSEHTQALNIGTGVGGLCWIVDSDDHDKLAPIGCVGELLIEGPLLARGYLNNPGKTTAAFIENPVWARNTRHSSRRMYKTGDLVRYNTDGTLEYLGRKDTQVKMNGRRLELGEIEHHLLTDDDVRNAMVMVARNGHSEDKLVAIMALGESATASTGSKMQLIGKASIDTTSMQLSRLRQHLSSQLPAYMVPAVWIAVEDMSLNTSGKLDRSKVARWVEEMDEETYRQIVAEEEEASGPTTAMDRRLRELIQQVLNLPIEQVVLQRSFLGLGGDSITAMQLVSRGRADGIVLRVQDILESRSISQLALVVKASGASSSITAEDELNVAFELSPIQKMYFDMSRQKANHFNQSFFLRLRRHIRPQAVAQAIGALVRQHSMLRSRFVQKTDESQWSQLITKDVAGSYQFRTHEVATREDITAIMLSSQASLNVASGPVFVTDLFNVANDGQLLFMVAHHLVIDLVSWRVILHDLEEILESETLLADKPFPFQAWCKLQAQHAQLHLTPGMVLPFDVTLADYDYWGMTDKTNVYGDTITESFTLDAETTSQLLGSCQDALGTEPVEVFVATLLQAFSHTFKDRSSPTVFSEGHGREPWNAEIDLSGTVGWFTTISPIHVPVIDGSDLVDTIRQTKDIRRKLPGNGWPYFASRFLNVEGIKCFGNHYPMELLFNYLGRYQQLERKDGLLSQEPLIPRESLADVSRDVSRLALFEVTVSVEHGVAQFSVLYNRHMQRRAGVGHWMGAWKQLLHQATARLISMKAERTLSDFPLLSITYAGLEKLSIDRTREIGVSSIEEIEDVYPCSPMQQGLLLSQTRESGAYEVQFMFEVVASQEGSLVEMERLLLAWQLVVDRHAALRTVFIDSVTEEGLFDQVVLKKTTARTSRLQCAGDGTVALAMLIEQEPMRYGKAWPPHEVTVCQTASGKVLLKLEVSHAVMDAASLSILLGDFNLAYEGILPQGPAPLYSEYIKYIQDRPLHHAMEFWKEHLADVKPCHFPLLNNGSNEVSRLQYVAVDLELHTNALYSFCESNGVTVANVVQTVWGLVLRSYTGSDEVCFGYLASGRDTAIGGVEETVGPFINMLVSRMNIAEASSVSQLVKTVQESYIAGLEHQHYSLAQIQHDLGLSGKPLFNTLMSVQKVQAPKFECPAIAFDSVAGHDPTEVSRIYHDTGLISRHANTATSTTSL
jgi:amino acid adenylation domain-containing protein/non-ribosomal peptide synthase protein (TIGR01720 family)